MCLRESSLRCLCLRVHSLWNERSRSMSAAKNSFCASIRFDIMLDTSTAIRQARAQRSWRGEKAEPKRYNCLAFTPRRISIAGDFIARCLRPPHWQFGIIRAAQHRIVNCVIHTTADWLNGPRNSPQTLTKLCVVSVLQSDCVSLVSLKLARCPQLPLPITAHTSVSYWYPFLMSLRKQKRAFALCDKMYDNAYNYERICLRNTYISSVCFTPFICLPDEVPFFHLYELRMITVDFPIPVRASPSPLPQTQLKVSIIVKCILLFEPRRFYFRSRIFLRNGIRTERISLVAKSNYRAP